MASPKSKEKKQKAVKGGGTLKRSVVNRGLLRVATTKTPPETGEGGRGETRNKKSRN